MNGNKQRLVSLDVLRGMTVFLMVLVNNGAGPQHFHALEHSQWNGLTPCDLVFPFFLFMVGVSVHLSLGRSECKPVWRVVRRTLLLFLIGVALHAWDMVLGGTWHFLPGLRLWGVLQRIALCYGIVSLLVLYVPRRVHTWLVVVLLAVYMAVLMWGNGYAMDESNVLCRVDRWLVGEAHLYHKSPIDPEGLLGVIPSIAHTLLGVMVGRLLTQQRLPLAGRLRYLALLGVILVVAGAVLSLYFPLNKRIWSPSYVLVTCGLATTLLSLLTWVIDVRGWQRWAVPCRMFGVNPFFLYLLSEMLAPVLSGTGVTDGLYAALAHAVAPPVASLLYGLFFCSIISLVAAVMWHRRWIVKI